MAFNEQNCAKCMAIDLPMELKALCSICHASICDSCGGTFVSKAKSDFTYWHMKCARGDRNYCYRTLHGERLFIMDHPVCVSDYFNEFGGQFNYMNRSIKCKKCFVLYPDVQPRYTRTSYDDW
jgi:hypothetical protein